MARNLKMHSWICIVWLASILFMLVLGCGGGRTGSGVVSEEDQTPPEAAAEQLVTPMTSAPPGDPPGDLSTDMTTDMISAPIDDEPMKVKIDRVLEQARETKKEYEAFRERMFDEAFAQSQVILCGTYRLQLLSGKAKDFYKKEPERYIEPLQDVLARQGSEPFVDLSRERPTPSSYESIAQEEVVISIPKSEPYTKKSLTLAKLTFRKQPVSINSSDGLTTEFEEQEVLDRVFWNFDPLVKCDQSFRESVVNSPKAKKDSSRRMAILLASALGYLREYPGKLETVEQVWARANDLQPLLSNLNAGLEFDEDDPTARRDVHNYERELTQALADLSRAKAEGRIEPNVDQDEVKEILRLFH